MSDAALQACLIGAGSFGAHALEALARSELVRLVGVSDRDRRLAEAASGNVCGAYDDHRRALVETAPQAVFLAVPPAPAAELARLAAQRGIHVWRQVPLARNLPEAVELCRRMDRADRQFVVGTERRYRHSYRHARTLRERLGRIYMVRGHYEFNQGPDLAWRGDKDAGGGALIELGYHMLDLIIWLMGMPGSILAVTGTGQRAAGEADLPVYDSDDSAVIVMRYPHQAVAVVNVTRCFNPLREGLTLYGEAGTIAASAGECIFRDRHGAVVDTLTDDETPAGLFGRMIDDFARTALANAPRYACSGWESLRTLACVEAAYLSDRTGACEDPHDLLAGYDLTEADCLKTAPKEEPAP